jgi:hypothetical protein
MKLCMFAAAVVLACVATAPDAAAGPILRLKPQDTGTSVDFLGDGGVKYTFTRSALTAVAGVPDVSFVVDDFFVAARGHRDGCILSTPWVPVALTSGKALPYSHFKVEWANGVLPPSEPTKALFEFVVAINHADGQTSKVERRINTGDLALAPTYRTDVYHGIFDSLAPEAKLTPLTQASVSDRDNVQVRICDVRPLVEITLHDIAVEVTP